MSRALRILIVLLGACYIAALLAYLFHSLTINPQYDTQVLRYAAEFNKAFDQGKMGEWYIAVRKYPLLYVFPFAATYRVVSWIGGSITIPIAYFLGRMLTILFGAGVVIVTRKISRRLYDHTLAVTILLLLSIFFFQFSTAVRPHVPVAFWTMLALYYSLKLREDPTRKIYIGAFGSAFLALCTLQSGLFAFLFPLWAVLSRDRIPKTIVKALLGTIALCALAVPFGYPFMLWGAEQAGQAGGLDFGHDVPLAFQASHPLFILGKFLGAELPLLIFAVLGIGRVMLGKDTRTSAFFPILLFILLYFIVFGFFQGSDARYFVVLLPLLALLGAPAFTASSRIVQIVFIVLGILMYVRFIFLGMGTDTFQQVSTYIEGTEGNIAIAGAPPNFFSFDYKRYVAHPQDADFFVHADAAEDIDVPEGSWKSCAQFIASPTTTDSVLLWTDTPWALWQLFTAHSIGPNIIVYCKA